MLKVDIEGGSYIYTISLKSARSSYFTSMSTTFFRFHTGTRVQSDDAHQSTNFRSQGTSTTRLFACRIAAPDLGKKLRSLRSSQSRSTYLFLSIHQDYPISSLQEKIYIMRTTAKCAGTFCTRVPGQEPDSTSTPYFPSRYPQMASRPAVFTSFTTISNDHILPMITLTFTQT
jgi:hypothetical protein